MHKKQIVLTAIFAALVFQSACARILAPSAQNPTASPTENPDGSGSDVKYQSHATAYYPHDDAMEGGDLDRMGHKLYTLQQFLGGEAPYVSVAMDEKAFVYGTPLEIPEIEAKYQKKILFKVVDTGGAFEHKGTSRIDICVGSYKDTIDSVVNQWITLEPLTK